MPSESKALLEIWLINQSIDQWNNQSINQRNEESTDRTINQSIDGPKNRSSTNQSTNQCNGSLKISSKFSSLSLKVLSTYRAYHGRASSIMLLHLIQLCAQIIHRLIGCDQSLLSEFRCLFRQRSKQAATFLLEKKSWNKNQSVIMLQHYFSHKKIRRKKQESTKNEPSELFLPFALWSCSYRTVPWTWSSPCRRTS